MTIGYDEPRPSKKNYEDFEKKLVDGISKLNIEGLSLMFYGSYARKTATYGRSDIDAIIIFNDDVVIDKNNLLAVSEVIKNSLDGNNIPLQFTVSDLRTMKNGIFNSYDPSYTESIEKDGIILYGPDYRKEFTYTENNPKLRQHSSMRFNLRKARTNLLMSKYYSKNDNVFIEKFNKSLDSIINCSRQVILLDNPISFYDGRSKFSTFRTIELTYPEINMKPLYDVRYMLTQDLSLLDKIYKNQSEAITLWCEALSTTESIVKSYLDKNYTELKGFRFIKIPKDIDISKMSTALKK